MAPKEALHACGKIVIFLEKSVANVLFCLEGSSASLVGLSFVSWNYYIYFKVFFSYRENPLTLAGEKGHVELVSLLLSRLVEACY